MIVCAKRMHMGLVPNVSTKNQVQDAVQLSVIQATAQAQEALHGGGEAEELAEMLEQMRGLVGQRDSEIERLEVSLAWPKVASILNLIFG